MNSNPRCQQCTKRRYFAKRLAQKSCVGVPGLLANRAF
ncbi:hypothetical protein KPSA1_01920 [Pseudomonas syringae pv. actinidiae]|uniref:Uncharacterized protein n=1 Tax=Pseudomonas syringae pv. actinidiae TaxID=103796 RepID=A0A2V0QDR8_PSESF|nr:hypothetical protein KPSA1_01920 [Pseudomonas syringae pv. actinidiae]